MKNIVLLFTAFVIFSSLSACNTVSGIGKDLKSAGNVMQDAAD